MSQMPMPDDWDLTSFCRWAVCWPDSPKWRAILHGLLETPMQGRFWDFSTGNFLALRESFRQAYNYNFTLEEVIMSCGDNGIALALEHVAQALVQMAANQATANQVANQVSLTNNFCCEQTLINSGGNVVANITTPLGETTPIYGTQEPGSLQPGTFPPGFENQAEYQLDKCQMSNLIFDGWVMSLRNLAAFGVFNGIALAGLVVAALAGIIVFPPAAIPIMCAAIGVLSVNVTILAVVADELEANRQYWVCIFYTSDSVEEIVAFIADALDALIATLQTTGPIGFAIKQICLLLLNSDTLNGLMEKRAHIDYPNADCSTCEQCNVTTGLTINIGQIDSDDEATPIRTMTITSQPYNPGGGLRQTIVISVPFGCQLEILDLDIVGGTWDGLEDTPQCPAENTLFGYTYSCDDETLSYVCGTNTLLNPIDGIEVAGMYSFNLFQITVQLSVSECA